MVVKDAAPGIAEIMIYDEISCFGITAKQFKLDLDSLEGISQITLKINSPGGDVVDGCAIYNTLMEYPATVVCEIDGIAASIASVIAMAGDTIRMPANTFMMIHNPWAFTMGDADQLRHDADVLDKMKKNAIAAYQTHAKKLDEEEISELMNDESWLTAEDCKTYGLCDEIIDCNPKDRMSIKAGKLKIPEKVFAMLATGKKPEIPAQATVPTPKSEPSPSTTQATAVKPAANANGGVMNKCPKCGKDVNSEFACCNHCGAIMKPENSVSVAHQREIEEAKAQAAREATHRMREIQVRCRKFKLPQEFEESLLNSKDSLEACIAKIVDQIPATPVAPDVTMGADATDKFRQLAKTGLCAGAGLEKDHKVVAEARKNDAPNSIHTLIRACLRKEGRISQTKVDNMLPSELAAEGLRFARMGINEGTSDFPAILADVANKALEIGMTDEETTFQNFCGTGETKDFKTLNLVKLSNFGDLKTIGEGENFERGRFADKKETVSISTKGRMFNLSRQAIVNDDLNAFVAVPRAMVGAAQRGINHDVYDSLTASSLTGPLMTEDGVRMFNAASHVNLLTGTGATVPTIASLGLMRTMLAQIKMLAPEKSAAAQPTNATAKYLISGTKNQTIIEQCLFSPTDYKQENPAVVNPFYGKIEPIFDPYLQIKLDAASKASTWYLAASQDRIPSIVVYYLAGNRVPTIRNQPSEVGEALGISWDLYIDWGIGFPDWRGMVMCDGATTL